MDPPHPHPPTPTPPPPPPPPCTIVSVNPCVAGPFVDAFSGHVDTLVLLGCLVLDSWAFRRRKICTLGALKPLTLVIPGFVWISGSSILGLGLSMSGNLACKHPCVPGPAWKWLIEARVQQTMLVRGAERNGYRGPRSRNQGPIDPHRRPKGLTFKRSKAQESKG